MDGMVNRGELLINVVTSNKPKTLTGLNPNGKWAGLGVFWFPNTDVDPPANRQCLTHPRYISGTW
jgi:hypothetical protein